MQLAFSREMKTRVGGPFPRKKRPSDINALLPSIFKMQKLLTVCFNS